MKTFSRRIESAPPKPEIATSEWLQALFAKRQMGRRMQPDGKPPYLTNDGPVLIDRRSLQDRRRPLAPNPDPRTS